MKSILVFVWAGILISGPVVAQTDSSAAFSWSGYVEIYHLYNFNEPPNNTQPGFVYSHSRHNEFNANLAFLKGSYSHARVRANLALAAGTYINANYAAEPGVLKNIFEANAGVKLSSTKELWLDAGIFGSHIGFESAVSKDCPTLTRSLMAENSPYYESGAKLTYTTPNGKWMWQVLVLNGWQQIRKSDSTNRLGLGTQIQFKPTTQLTLNSSTFLGARPDGSSAEAANRTRMFHNLYGIFQFTSHLSLTAGFDYGWEQQQQGSSAYHTWYSPVGIVRYAVSEKMAVAGRIERYADPDGVITGNPDFQVDGYSVTVEYVPVKNVLCRLEGRTFVSPDKTFTDRSGQSTRYHPFVTTSVAISF